MDTEFDWTAPLPPLSLVGIAPELRPALLGYMQAMKANVAQEDVLPEPDERAELLRQYDMLGASLARYGRPRARDFRDFSGG